MRQTRPATASLLFTAAVLAACAAPAQAQDSAASLALALGDRIEQRAEPSGDAVDWGRATAVVDAPVEQVLSIITDYANYREFMPHFQQSRVLSRRGNNAVVYMEARVAYGTATLWAQLRIYGRRPRGETQIVEGRMLTGNMERFIARWEVTPLDSGARALVDFRLLVDPDMPLPASLFTRENVKAARDTLRALRRRAGTPSPTRQVARNP